jgi:hypothetical protein
MELKFHFVQAISKSLELVLPGNAAPVNLKVLSGETCVEIGTTFRDEHPFACSSVSDLCVNKEL